MNLKPCIDKVEKYRNMGKIVSKMGPFQTLNLNLKNYDIGFIRGFPQSLVIGLRDFMNLSLKKLFLNLELNGLYYNFGGFKCIMNGISRLK